MLTTANFLDAAKWSGGLTLLCAVVAVLGFLFQWGTRFRLVGITGFMTVLTGGLFALGLVPLTHTIVPGAIHSTLIYDAGSTQAVIRVPPTITATQLDATLRQAAVDLFSYGRLGQGETQLTIRARTLLHPEPGLSQPLYLGQVQRSLSLREDDQMAVEIYADKLAQLPPVSK